MKKDRYYLPEDWYEMSTKPYQTDTLIMIIFADGAISTYTSWNIASQIEGALGWKFATPLQKKSKWRIKELPDLENVDIHYLPTENWFHHPVITIDKSICPANISPTVLAEKIVTLLEEMQNNDV